MGPEPARRLELRLGAARQLQLHRRQQHRPDRPDQTALSDEENLQGLAFGGGLKYGTGEAFSLGFDYAYKYLGVLGATNFFSFTLGW